MLPPDNESTVDHLLPLSVTPTHHPPMPKSSLEKYQEELGSKNSRMSLSPRESSQSTFYGKVAKVMP